MVLAVIPSRYQSSRFPGKALAVVDGVPLVVRVARRVREAGVVDRVLVATDDERIARAVAADGFDVCLEAKAYRCGSDRVAGATSGIGADVILNVQGDEPLVDREALEAALAALRGNDIGTVGTPTEALALLTAPDVVKVEVDEHGRAVDFARDALDLSSACSPLVHHGIYSFSAASLRHFTALSPTRRERSESLEQLRALDSGMSIGVFRVDREYASVNWPEDVPRVEALLRGQGHARPANGHPGAELGVAGEARGRSGRPSQDKQEPTPREKLLGG
jgi:3-deoxy-manno-octulosonate cytidylyltransferase (CMP-KDO synthetase)